MDVYSTKGLLGDACTPKQIFYFISERKREWTIGVKRDGFDVCAKYKVLIGEAIPNLAGGDKILEQSMNLSIAREVRSMYSADPVPPRKPSVKSPPIALAKETPAAEGPSSEMPVAEEPSSLKKKSRRGTSSRGGTQA